MSRQILILPAVLAILAMVLGYVILKDPGMPILNPLEDFAMQLMPSGAVALGGVVVAAFYFEQKTKTLTSGLDEAAAKLLLDKIEFVNQRLDGILTSYDAVFPLTFVRNLDIAKKQKLQLAACVVDDVLETDSPIFVDGGTTLYYLAHVIRKKGTRKIPIATNNVPLALTLCEERQYPCTLIAGTPEREYAAILGPLATHYVNIAGGQNALPVHDSAVEKCIPANVLVISGTHCSFSKGLWGRNQEDRLFKAELLRRFPTIIIVVDGGKVVTESGAGSAVEVDEWQKILRQKDVKLITTELAANAPSMDRTKFDVELALFDQAGALFKKI